MDDSQFTYLCPMDNATLPLTLSPVSAAGASKLAQGHKQSVVGLLFVESAFNATGAIHTGLPYLVLKTCPRHRHLERELDALNVVRNFTLYLISLKRDRSLVPPGIMHANISYVYLF